MTTMIFSPLRKAVIAGAAVVALGAAGGVAVHAATSSSPTSASLTASTPSPSPNATKNCVPNKELGIARQVLAIAAKDTGLTQQQILDQLRAGKTFDQIAGSKAQTVEQDLLAQLKSRLDKAVSSGKLTSARETALLDKAKTAIEKAMSSNLSSRIPASGSLQPCGKEGRDGKHGLLRALITVTAQKTGLSEQQVMQDLRNGESIDQIAGSKAADIKATVLQQLEQDLSSRLDKIMSHSGGKRSATPSETPGA
jgi:ribosomal protein S4